MRNLIVSLMTGEEVFEESIIEGDVGWMERYQEVCKRYASNIMTNDKLEMRVRVEYQ